MNTREKGCKYIRIKRSHILAQSKDNDYNGVLRHC